MTDRVSTVERARDAAQRGSWAEAYEQYRDLDPPTLAPDDLDALADAAFWMCRIDESIAARQKAHTGYARAGRPRPAAVAAWLLYYEFLIQGEETVAGGWLQRMRRHLETEADCPEHGYLAFADAEVALWGGNPTDALAHAERLAALGQRHDHLELLALGTELQGRCLLAMGRVPEGTALLDDAMCSVVAGELSPMITGWIYCNVISACWELADLRRAGAWTDAAMRWCEDLPTSSAPYQGICRVHRVEIATLRGRWTEAGAEAERTCEELLAYAPRLAGAAFYAAGEVRRHLGDLSGAESLFGQAYELGTDPQPGLALVQLAQGKGAAAEAALRRALTEDGPGRLGRVRLLAAQAEVARHSGDLDTLRAATEELESASAGFPGTALEAAARFARGALQLAEGEVDVALGELRRAVAIWQEIDAPYEVARTRIVLGETFRAAGDEDGARLEFQVAQRIFDRLGAAAATGQTAAPVEQRAAAPQGLTPRESEVLRLLATGRSNRDIAAELVVSEHTVARHLSHIFAKLGVSSRTAAAAFAFEHDLA